MKFEKFSNSLVFWTIFFKGGRVSILGLPKKPLHIENVLQDIVFKSLTITTVHGRRIFHTWNECERLIHEKKVLHCFSFVFRKNLTTIKTTYKNTTFYFLKAYDNIYLFFFQFTLFLYK